MNKKDNFTERRKHFRLPIIHGIIEPVDLTFENPNHPDKMLTQPAILSNLSAGGMRLMTFLEMPLYKSLELILDLPGLGSLPVKGKISWVHGKGGVYLSGISFIEISEAHKHKINLMAEDYGDCETRIMLKLPEACVDNCKCHCLCNKPQKDETLFENTDRKNAKRK
ncbi:MAG: PilZ domain-containing protein [Elusimicrobia bacterium]|nr:PilZ domain-containing protein [Elusimicrobiota bacterium]